MMVFGSPQCAGKHPRLHSHWKSLAGAGAVGPRLFSKLFVVFVCISISVWCCQRLSLKYYELKEGECYSLFQSWRSWVSCFRSGLPLLTSHTFTHSFFPLTYHRLSSNKQATITFHYGTESIDGAYLIVSSQLNVKKISTQVNVKKNEFEWIS